MLNTAINSYFTHLYYTDSILNAFYDPLCLKLCWYSRRVPSRRQRMHLYYKQLSKFHWCHFHLYMSIRAAKFFTKLISQSCGDSQSTVCLPREVRPVYRQPNREHSWTSVRLEKEAWVKADCSTSAVLNTSAIGPLMYLTNGDEKCVLKLCMYKTLVGNLVTCTRILTPAQYSYVCMYVCIYV